MLTVQSIADALNRWAPAKFAADWDNVGLLVGAPTAEVSKVLICLDVSDRAIDCAIGCGAQMIVSHHPLIFHPIKSVRFDQPLGRRLSRLIHHDIAVFAAHTNLDSTSGGVNDVLASKIGLIDVKPLDDDPTVPSLGRIGHLTHEMSPTDFADHVKKMLRADHVRLIDAGVGAIKKVGISSGAGAYFMMKAKFHGADAFVTGDVKYHEAQAAIDHGVHLIDAGHFYSEHPIVEAIAQRLRADFDGLSVETFERETDVFRTV